MRTVLRRIRGALGTALTWAMVWPMAGVVVQLTQRMENGTLAGPTMLIWAAINWAIAGAIGGLIFSLLTATDGRRTLQQFSLNRSAMWGVFSAAVVPLSMEGTRWFMSGRPPGTYAILMLSAFAAAGALSGAGTVLLALRAEVDNAPEPWCSANENLELLPACASHLNRISIKQRAKVQR